MCSGLCLSNLTLRDTLDELEASRLGIAHFMPPIDGVWGGGGERGKGEGGGDRGGPIHINAIYTYYYANGYK